MSNILSIQIILKWPSFEMYLTVLNVQHWTSDAWNNSEIVMAYYYCNDDPLVLQLISWKVICVVEKSILVFTFACSAKRDRNMGVLHPSS